MSETKKPRTPFQADVAALSDEHLIRRRTSDSDQQGVRLLPAN